VRITCPPYFAVSKPFKGFLGKIFVVKVK
jgi:hypothetical protein